jgi:hypothetical protein
LRRVHDGPQIAALIHRRSQRNGFTMTKDGYELKVEFAMVNPFDASPCTSRPQEAETADSTEIPTIDWDDDQVRSIVGVLSNSLGDVSPGQPLGIMTKSMKYGILPWCARVFVLINRLPTLSNQVILVLTNIIDLYITTAFRICAGNGRNERLLLGIEKPQVFHKDDLDAMVQSRFTSQAFVFGRRPQQTHSSAKPLLRISDCVEAEMCSFVMSREKYQELSVIRNLIVDGQNRLKSIVKLTLVDKWITDPTLEDETNEEDFAVETARVLEKRIAASFNVASLAAIMLVAANHLSSYDDSFLDFKNSVIAALPLFLELSNRMSTMRAIRGKAIVQEVRMQLANFESVCIMARSEIIHNVFWIIYVSRLR